MQVVKPSFLIFRESDDKVLKGSNYEAPDLQQFIGGTGVQ